MDDEDFLTILQDLVVSSDRATLKDLEESQQNFSENSIKESLKVFELSTAGNRSIAEKTIDTNKEVVENGHRGNMITA